MLTCATGLNKVPNINEFLSNLDRSKKDRDATIDAERAQKQGKNNLKSEATPHHSETTSTHTKDYKVVTDPTTGSQVGIDDVDATFVERSKNPQLSVPNANLGKDTPVKTDPSQTNPEYKVRENYEGGIHNKSTENSLLMTISERVNRDGLLPQLPQTAHLWYLTEVITKCIMHVILDGSYWLT